jgi:EAL domain-containing protein (putative c-di-GMP-specific phosphodiesterase class I)
MSEGDPTFVLAGEPVLEFVPVVDLSDGRLLGMEAQVVWDHPTSGRLSAEEMHASAEVSGDSTRLNQWLATRACAEARTWSSSVQLAVGCTTAQLRRGQVSGVIAAAIESSGLGSGQVIVQIPDEAVSDQRAVADLGALTSMGVQLAVDDVGTGWATFEPLKRISAYTVKIDGSMVAALEPGEGMNRLLVEMVITLARAQGIATIAGGVETAEQIEMVRALPADAAQGSFFGPPLSAEEAAAMASSQTVARFSLTEPQTLVPVADEGARPAVKADIPDEPTDEGHDEPPDEPPAESSGTARPPSRAAAKKQARSKRTDGGTPKKSTQSRRSPGSSK